MSDQKISQLPPASLPLDGSELVPLVQSGSTVQATTQDLINLGTNPFFIPENIVFYGTTCQTVNYDTNDYYPFNSESISIEAPNLTTVNKSFYINCSSFYNDTEKLLFPVLSYVGRDVFINNGVLITEINLNSLSIAGGLNIYGNDSLTQLSFPSLSIVNVNVSINNNSSLMTFSFPNLTSIGGSYVNFATNALDQTSIDGILAKLVEIGYSGGEINLSGGTNAAPSVTGAADVATLISNGCTVTTN